MGWLRQLFGSRETAPQSPPEPRHDLPSHAPKAFSNVIAGWEFAATMNPRVPLSVLRHHGEVHHCELDDLPLYTTDQSQGIWVTKTKTFRELGLDIDQPDIPQIMASPAGQVDAARFLPFLIAYREIVESEDSKPIQQARLEGMRANPEWSGWIDACKLKIK